MLPHSQIREDNSQTGVCWLPSKNLVYLFTQQKQNCGYSVTGYDFSGFIVLSLWKQTLSYTCDIKTQLYFSTRVLYCVTRALLQISSALIIALLINNSKCSPI